MIDYKEHRKKLEEYRDVKDMWENRDDYAHIKYRDMERAQTEYHNGIIVDAEELLDKAEKWDKVNKGLKLGELEEVMDKAEEMEKWKKRAVKLAIISTDADERAKKYWLALEKLSYKCIGGWTGDDCAEYASEAIKGYDPT